MFTHYKKETAADNFLLSRVLLLLTLALLLAWLLWFFFAAIPLSLSNEAIVGADARTVISLFPPDIALRELEIGQVAFLRLDDLPSEFYALRLSHIGTVLLENGMIEIEFELETENTLASGMSGQIEIEKPERSPFQLTLDLLQDG